MPTSKPQQGPRPGARALLAFVSTYTFVWGLITLGMATSIRLGLSFHDAEHLFVIIGLTLLLALFLWAFASSRPWLVWPLLLVCGLLMAHAASRLSLVMLEAATT